MKRSPMRRDTEAAKEFVRRGQQSSAKSMQAAQQRAVRDALDASRTVGRLGRSAELVRKEMPKAIGKPAADALAGPSRRNAAGRRTKAPPMPREPSNVRKATPVDWPHGYGYCWCGCGAKTAISRQKGNGYEKGEPKRFLRAHHNTYRKQVEGVPCRCENCSKNFQVSRSQAAHRASGGSDGNVRFCSRKCWRESDAAGLTDEDRRRSAEANRERKAERNPAYVHGGRSGVRDRAGERRFDDGRESCSDPSCSSGGYKLHKHHVVYEAQVKKSNGDRWSSMNCLTLCASCHARHHGQITKLPLVALRDENFAFAAELLGPAAHAYLRRRYGGEDPRLDELAAIPAGDRPDVRGGR